MRVDVVVVAYRSADHLRACVEPLAGQEGIAVVVVDNACPEDSASLVADLPVQVVRTGANLGFGGGCNAGARASSGGAILFLNPDSAIEPDAVRAFGELLEREPGVGAVGPRILEAGETYPTMRRTPRLRTAAAEALFLHHLARDADWTTEIVREGYDQPHEDAEWLIGAALCVRRAAFEQIGGFDDRIFLYSEETDLCVRLREAGWRLRYEPSIVSHHEGSASSGVVTRAPLQTEGRIAYARLHETGLRYAGYRAVYAVHDLVRVPLAAARSRQHLRSRLEAAGIALGRRPARERGQ